MYIQDPDELDRGLARQVSMNTTKKLVLVRNWQILIIPKTPKQKSSPSKEKPSPSKQKLLSPSKAIQRKVTGGQENYQVFKWWGRPPPPMY